jgi:hypothetical protein
MIHVAFPSTLFLTNALYDRHRPSFPTLYLSRNGVPDDITRQGCDGGGAAWQSAAGQMDEGVGEGK